jgi:membrane-bound lytic murein transglycosylase MltF
VTRPEDLIYTVDEPPRWPRLIFLGAQHAVLMKVYPVAAWLARQTPGLRIVAQVQDDPQPLGIGFNKNSPLLVAAVNGVLSEMKQDGTYARLAHKWGVP